MKEPRRSLDWVQWLYAHAGDDTPIGDLARDAMEDCAISLEMNQKEYLAYMHNRISAGTVSREILRVIEAAIIAHRAYRNKIDMAIKNQSEKTWLGDGSAYQNRKQY